MSTPAPPPPRPERKGDEIELDEEDDDILDSVWDQIRHEEAAKKGEPSKR